MPARRYIMCRLKTCYRVMAQPETYGIVYATLLFMFMYIYIYIHIYIMYTHATYTYTYTNSNLRAPYHVHLISRMGPVDVKS